jgi:hypothetical protein
MNDERNPLMWSKALEVDAFPERRVSAVIDGSIVGHSNLGVADALRLQEAKNNS